MEDATRIIYKNQSNVMPFDKVVLEWHDLTGKKIPDIAWRQVHIVANLNGQVVLVYLEKLGLYHLPGGHVEPGEDIDMTLRREFAEETGGEVIAWEPIGYQIRTDAKGNIDNQLRVYAKVANIKPEVIDVDGSHVMTKLVSIRDMTKELGWENPIGERIYSLVAEKFVEQKNTNAHIKWLLVDIGDVLLFKDRSKSFTELLSEELGVNLELAQAINREHFTTMETKNIDEADFTASLDKKLGYIAPKNIYEYFVRAYEKQIRPNTQFLDFLHEMRVTGIKTAVLSNTIAIYTEAQERAGISKQAGFDPIIFSWAVGMRKPDKNIFEFALNELKVAPASIIFIDNKEEHLRSAEKVGFTTILFDSTDQVITQLSRFGVY